MRRASVVIAAVLATLALAACGGSGGTSGGITVPEAWARPSPMMERAGAAYLVLYNASAADDKLLYVESDVARTIELHETKESGA